MQDVDRFLTHSISPIEKEFKQKARKANIFVKCRRKSEKSVF